MTALRGAWRNKLRRASEIDNQESKIKNASPVAIVTGAGSGVGRQLALRLSASGHRLALAARRRPTLEQTARDAVSAGASEEDIHIVPTDLCVPSACAALVAQTVERFGRLDVLANVAGFAVFSTIDEITDELWRTALDTNLSGPVHLTAQVWPHFSRRRAGLVVNVSSLASIDPFPRFAMYATAKAALNMFTHCTAREGEALGIRSVCIAPGAVETPMLRGLFDEATLPPDHTLDPGEVADVIADCILGRRSFESGELIEVPSP